MQKIMLKYLINLPKALFIFMMVFMSDVVAETSFEYTHDKTEVIENIEIEWLKEKKSGFSFFRIREGFDSERLVIVNQILKKFHDEKVGFFIGCKATFNKNESGIEDLRASLNYISQDLLGITFSASYFCDGMHNLGTFASSYLYNLSTLERVKLNDIFNINLSTKLEDDEYQTLNAQNVLTVKEIRNLAFSYEGWQLLEPNDQESCNYFDITIWRPANWTYIDKGILFAPSFPTVLKTVCERSFLIPFAELYRFKKLSFIFNFNIQ